MRLRTLLLVTVSCASGCVLGGASAEATGTYRVEWSESPGAPPPWCQPGWMVECRARPMADVLSNPDDDLYDRFACGLGLAVAAPAPIGGYQLTLTLIDAAGAALDTAGPVPVEVRAGVETGVPILFSDNILP